MALAPANQRITTVLMSYTVPKTGPKIGFSFSPSGPTASGSACAKYASARSWARAFGFGLPSGQLSGLTGLPSSSK